MSKEISSPQYPQKILVEVSQESDYQPALEEASKVRQAFPLAEFVLLLSPKAQPVIVGLPDPMQTNGAYERYKEQAKKESLEQAEELCGRFISLGAQARYIVEPYADISELNKIAEREEAELLIINGQARRSAFSRWIHGDRAAWLIRHAELPFIVASVEPKRNLTFTGLARTPGLELSKTERSRKNLGQLFPPYRAREHEVSFFRDRLRGAGSKLLVFGELGPELRRALEDQEIDISVVKVGEPIMDKGQFDSGLLIYTEISKLYSVEEQKAVLDFFQERLRDDGVLVADFFNPWLKFPVDAVVPSRDGEGNECIALDDGCEARRHIRVSARDYFEQIQHVEIVYWINEPDGTLETLRENLRSRFFSRYEVEHLMTDSGFRTESLFGTKYPGELVFVGRKNV